MKKKIRAGTVKSWACVVMLTFVLPLGAAELSHLLFTVGADAGTRVQAFISGGDVSRDAIETACPEVAFN